MSEPNGSVKGRRLLVAWFRFTVNGGIGRFIHVARVLNRFNHEVAFMSLTGDLDPDWPDFPGPVLTLKEALAQTWDAVMVPGAGAPNEHLALLTHLRNECFGVRVQHILNDASLFERFQAVNAALAPDAIVINNSHWSPGEYRRLAAAAFHILPGGVDTDCFHPLSFKNEPCTPPRWAVGGIATKNLPPLLGAMELWPEECLLHLYGAVPANLEAELTDLVRQGRVVHHGLLFDRDLAAFYRKMDVMVTTEERAGWCNAAAEAMACGVPSLVSRHGTVDFARHEENALVLDAVSPEAIAEGVTRLIRNTTLRRRLSENAALAMRSFSWVDYCRRLLGCVKPPDVPGYFRIPELGLHGKWDPVVRLRGLEPLLEQCEGRSVLDLGAAEGVVGYEFMKRGARLVHGFELDPARVAFARDLFTRAGFSHAHFRPADLSLWKSFEDDNRDLLRSGYDVVLFLGLYHHLPEATRQDALDGALSRCRSLFAVRTPEKLARGDDLSRFIRDRGFAFIGEEPASGAENMGWLGLFQRKTNS